MGAEAERRCLRKFPRSHSPDILAIFGRAKQVDTLMVDGVLVETSPFGLSGFKRWFIESISQVGHQAIPHFLSVLCHPYTLGSFPMSQLRDSHLDGQAQEAKNVMHDA